jgi:hypothetical protein
MKPFCFRRSLQGTADSKRFLFYGEKTDLSMETFTSITVVAAQAIKRRRQEHYNAAHIITITLLMLLL